MMHTRDASSPSKFSLSLRLFYFSRQVVFQMKILSEHIYIDCYYSFPVVETTKKKTHALSNVNKVSTALPLIECSL